MVNLGVDRLNQVVEELSYLPPVVFQRDFETALHHKLLIVLQVILEMGLTETHF